MDEGLQKAKGVVESGVVKKEITHPNNVDTLFNNEIMKHKNTSIQSRGHELYTEEVNKKSLRPFDDKRYILEDGISSHAFGHRKINAKNT